MKNKQKEYCHQFSYERKNIVIFLFQGVCHPMEDETQEDKVNN